MANNSPDIAARILETLAALRDSLQKQNKADVANSKTPNQESKGLFDEIKNLFSSLSGRLQGQKEAKINEKEMEENAKKEQNILKTREDNAEIEKKLLALLEDKLREVQKRLDDYKSGGGTRKQVDAALEIQDELKKEHKKQQENVNEAEQDEIAQRKPAYEAHKAWKKAQEKLVGSSKKLEPSLDAFDKVSKKAKKIINRSGLNTGGGKAGSLGNVAGDLGSIAMDAPRAMAGDPTAIADIVAKGAKMTIENFKAIGEHLKGMGQEGVKFMASDRGEKEIGHAFEGMKHGAKAMGRITGGPVGGAIMEKLIDMNPMVQFVETITKAIGFVRDFGDQLHNANMQFAQFSGGMASVKARQEVRDLMLSMKKGDVRADSAESLEEGRNELNQTMAPIEDSLAIIKNFVIGEASKFIATLLKPVAQAAEVVIQWLPKSETKDKTNDPGLILERSKDPYSGRTMADLLDADDGVEWR